VVCGPQLAIEPLLATCGWTIQTAFIERLHLDIRQRVAASGRRVKPRCQGAAGWRDQVTLLPVYHHVVLPHPRLRPGLAEPLPTNGRGSGKMGRPCPPAMAAGLTDHVWSLQEVRCYRVPPWPHTPTVSNRRAVEDRGVERLSVLRYRLTGTRRRIANECGGCMTGGVRRDRQERRGPKTISPGRRYATSALLSPILSVKRNGKA
jgi:hypothetical protein